MVEETIQFIANYEDWKVIKKITITKDTAPLSIVDFLASLTYSTDDKIESNLRKTVELDKVDIAIKELAFKKGDSTKAIEEVNSRYSTFIYVVSYEFTTISTRC